MNKSSLRESLGAADGLVVPVKTNAHAEAEMVLEVLDRYIKSEGGIPDFVADKIQNSHYKRTLTWRTLEEILCTYDELRVVPEKYRGIVEKYGTHGKLRI